MNLELPEDARVQIFIPPMGYVSPSDGAPVPSAPPAAQPQYFLVKGTALLMLIGAAYFLGGHSVQQAGTLQARAQSYGTQPPADDREPPKPREVPPAFTQQLQQTPTVTPPPGAAPSGAPAKSAFGLEE